MCDVDWVDVGVKGVVEIYDLVFVCEIVVCVWLFVLIDKCEWCIDVGFCKWWWGCGLLVGNE